jgi:hypothetical protein
VLLLSNIVAKVVCNFLIVCNSSCDKLKEREEDVETMCQLNLKKIQTAFCTFNCREWNTKNSLP